MIENGVEVISYAADMRADWLNFWIDIFKASLTPTIAFLGIYIAWQQWRTNRTRLKHELFDRRYAQFEAVQVLIINVLAKGIVDLSETMVFLQATQGARFIFGEDIQKYFQEVREKTSRLERLGKNASKLPEGEEKNKLHEEKEVIIEWFMNESKYSYKRFVPYLHLK